MSVQTSYSQRPVTARKGQFADNGPRKVESAHANGAPRVGNLVLLTGPTAGNLENAEAAPLPELTVDVNDILAATATAASALSITSASTPALSTALLSPARRVTATLNSHADWNATTMRIYGEDVMGNLIKEELAVPDAGNATIKSHQFFSRVTLVELDAQGGTNGSFTMGWSADEAVYHPETVGILVRDTAKEPLDSDDAVADNDKVDVLKQGKIFVAVEAAVSAKGGPAYLRCVNDTGVVRGQWRSTPATGFTRQPWASFEGPSDSDSIAVLHKHL